MDCFRALSDNVRIFSPAAAAVDSQPCCGVCEIENEAGTLVAQKECLRSSAH